MGLNSDFLITTTFSINAIRRETSSMTAEIFRFVKRAQDYGDMIGLRGHDTNCRISPSAVGAAPPLSVTRRAVDLMEA
jgi:hypothetical protein